MPRLAWFTPLPPSRSGIAAYSAELLPLVARHHVVDTFIDPRASETAPGGPEVAPGLPVFPSRDFVPRHRTRPYDLVVYQLGNARCHDYMWPYLVRFPGLVVLHDGQLHQARAMTLLTSGGADAYRDEFAFCHPDANPGIAEIVIAALGGSLFFNWPLLRVPIDAARVVAVHSPWLAADLADRYPGRRFQVIRMGVADPLGDPPAPGGPDGSAGIDIRRRHGIPPGCVLFAAYGMLTPEKRLSEIFESLRAVRVPGAHLMLVGQPADYYDVEADARAAGVGDRVRVTGYVPDGELGAYISAADVCLCLRWPTSRETSASWLRCLAAGKPTVITDLAHTTDVPALDPRSWTTMAGAPPGDAREGDAAGGEAPRGDAGDLGGPVCVAIDILDEQHSLRLAMRRLAVDPGLRRQLAENARAHWCRHHSPERMADDYDRAIDIALSRPAPDTSHMPPHLVQDGTRLTGNILERFGLSLETLGWT